MESNTMNRVVLFIIIGLFVFHDADRLLYGQDMTVGYVVKIEGTLIYIDRGYLDGVQSGQTYTLYRNPPRSPGGVNIGVI